MSALTVPNVFTQNTTAKASEVNANFQAIVDKFQGIDTDNLTDKLITNAKLGDKAVSQAKLGDNSVGTLQVIDLNITTAKLAALAVTEEKLASNAVTTSKIANDAVTTDKLLDDAVTTNKIVDDAITSDELADNSVLERNIINGAVTTNKIDDGAITSQKIAAGAVDTSQLADNAVQEENIIDDEVTVAKVSIPLKTWGNAKFYSMTVPLTYVDTSTVLTMDFATSGVDADTRIIPMHQPAGIIPADASWNVIASTDSLRLQIISTASDFNVDAVFYFIAVDPPATTSLTVFT